MTRRWGDQPDDLFDPAAIADEAIRANLDPEIFNKIDDRDVRRPRNWFEWCCDRNLLNVTPFPKQVEVCINLFGQFCPVCTDPKLMETDEQFGNKRLLFEPVDLAISDIVDRVQFLVDGKCPKCGISKPELISKGELNHYTNLAGVAGMRSSKTVMAGGLIATYQLARILLLPNPAKYFGQLENQTLHGTFVAVTATQAYDTLWQAFKDRVMTAPWFQQYHEFLDAEANRLGKEKFYDAKDSFVWYGHKQLSFSYCGPDIRTIRGRTRVISGIDELGWFDVQADASSKDVKIRLNSKETHEALIKSLRSIRSASMALRNRGELDPPDGLNLDVSSPSSMNDAIMQELREAREDPTIYAFHYSSWEFNPSLPLESLKSEMRNKKAFDRDYGAIPPLGVNQFMDNQPAVEKCQQSLRQDRLVSWVKRNFTDAFGDQTIYIEAKPLISDRTKPRILTIDTGLTNNSFAVELWSYDREARMPVCDVALECSPEVAGSERVLINFPMMFEKCVIPFLGSYRIILVVYDRWNSVDAVQRIRKDHKVEALQYTLKWNDFLEVKSRLIDSTIRLPKFETPLEEIREGNRKFDDIVRSSPAAHLGLQILTVREAGRKVVKPINGDDDLFRAMCLAIRFILDPAWTPRFEQYGLQPGYTKGTVGVMRSNRGEGVAMVQRQQNQQSLIGVRRSFRTGA